VAFIGLEKLINMYDGYRKQFVINHRKLLLTQHMGQHFIMQAECPHRQWPLYDASIENNAIVCPKHGISFSLADGLPSTSDATDCESLKVYSVAYEGNSLGIDSVQIL
jgi:3-phenylpropionate/trans-cinnamate dioxygenase ferredoxin subunit